MADPVELTTADKLTLIALWQRSERQDMLLYGALFLAGLTLTVFSSRLPQLTGIGHAEPLVSALLGGATLPKAAGELWKRVRSVRVLAFLAQAYAQGLAVAHADTVFSQRLKQFAEATA